MKTSVHVKNNRDGRGPETWLLGKTVIWAHGQFLGFRYRFRFSTWIKRNCFLLCSPSCCQTIRTENGYLNRLQFLFGYVQPFFCFKYQRRWCLFLLFFSDHIYAPPTHPPRIPVQSLSQQSQLGRRDSAVVHFVQSTGSKLLSDLRKSGCRWPNRWWVFALGVLSGHEIHLDQFCLDESSAGHRWLTRSSVWPFYSFLILSVQTQFRISLVVMVVTITVV